MLALSLCSLALSPAAPQSVPPPPGSDWVLPAGVTSFETGAGPIRVHSMTVPADAFLRVSGDDPFVVLAEEDVVIEGVLEASGFDAQPVGSLFFPDQPLPGAPGGPGGAAGGDGYPGGGFVAAVGGTGLVRLPGGGGRPLGGGGGESGVLPLPGLALGPLSAGGGGGAFGPDAPGGGVGLVASPGLAGHPLAVGAQSGVPAPAGGAVGGRAFVDADPRNDFFGVGLTPSGARIHGELAYLRGGAGGGAGGATVHVPGSLPATVGQHHRYLKGFGGGGGGGVVVLAARRIALGPSARVRAAGGAGAGADAPSESYGASGGGSGGLVMLAADTVDLAGAQDDALHARGGAGGVSWGGATGLVGLGGVGGPGLVQVHVADAGADLVLPGGKTLADLSAPDAHVLLPVLP